MSTPPPPFEIPKAPWPIRPFDWFFGKVAQGNIDAQQSSVKDPPKWRRVQRWGIIRYLAVMAAGLLFIVGTDIHWWGMVGVFILTYYAAQGASQNMSAGRKYLDGWLEGRGRMIASLKEASDRGLDLEEWVVGEYERDVMTLFTGHNVSQAEIEQLQKELHAEDEN